MEKKFITENYLLNLKTGFWYKLNESDKGKEVKGVLVKDHIYLIGGHSEQDLDLIECYNLTNGEKTIESKMPRKIARPAITSNDHFIYIFDNGYIYVYNTISRELKAFLIDLKVHEAEMHYYDNKLYIFGGKTNYTKRIILAGCEEFELEAPEGSNGFYCVDINEFNLTKSTV